MGGRGDDQVRLGRYRGKFCAVIGAGRSRQRISLGTADPGLARTRLAEFVQQRDRLSRPNRVTVGAILAAYLADRRPEVADPARIEFAIARLRPAFGDLLPSHIDRSRCRAYVRDRGEAGASVGTAHTELAALRAALRWAERQSPPWVDRAPFIWMPPKPPPRDRHLSRDEAAALLAACVAPHVRLFVLLALHTAARVTAILQITWDRVDLERGLIYLRDPEQPRTRKGRATVPVNDTLAAELRRAREGAVSPWVVELAGRQVGSVKHGVASAAQRAGLAGVSPHVLRHTAGVWMAEAGISMPEIAQYMGHTDSRVTERVYARFSPTYLRRAAAALESA